MKITIGVNDICKTCQYKNPLNCEAEYDDIFLDDTKNISDCKCYKAKVKGKTPTNPIVAEIVDYLNLKANKKYRTTTGTTIEFINGRLREKYTLADFKKVIDIKVSEWKGTEFEKYLNPETLFRPGNFEKYVNQTEIKPKDKLQSKSSYDMEGIKQEAEMLPYEQLIKRIERRLDIGIHVTRAQISKMCEKDIFVDKADTEKILKHFETRVSE